MNKIPQNIEIDLALYINQKCRHAESGWEFSNQDEDTITGDFLGNLRTAGWVNKSDFKYRFYYNKIRGRGPNALENKVGSDGIITIEIDDNGTNFYKSFVFQAKKTGNQIDNTQLKKMEKHFPSNHVIFKYTPNGYFVEDYLGKEIPICKFITEVFLKCKIGIVGTYYNANTNEFINKKGVMKIFEPRNELIIKVVVR